MDSAPKQQIVERVKQVNNILVTVSNDPTVDQLASCIGLTLLLNSMGKHATAVFSGQVPSTLEFLQPEKTLEPNTDSLRDFIISLDKSKADKLRYKVEDQVVRIFITPYRTKISESDLVFSQGDFNVEVVIALGVKEREHIDNAISAHGRILHDATVISINAGESNSNNDVGSINWQDPAASSLCEMVVSISEAFGSGLIDNQMATAFLTGIVAQTERFSNKKTSPKVMTMSAQLMAAGANQQLIATKLAQGINAPLNPVVADNANPDNQAGNDVINIEHGDEINIDDKGNLAIKSEPEAEATEAEPMQQPEEPQEPLDEEQPNESEISLPEPGIGRAQSGALPDRLPVGDNQGPVGGGDNSFALRMAHKVIQPLPHERSAKKDHDKTDEPESKITTKRTVLDSEDDMTPQHPFTANDQPPDESSPLDITGPVNDPGLLEHSKPAANAKTPKAEPTATDKAIEDIKRQLQEASARPDEPQTSADSARQAVEQIHSEIPDENINLATSESSSVNTEELDELHNPPEVKPEHQAEPEKSESIPEPFKMPELAIKPLTDLPTSLDSPSPEPLPVEIPSYEPTEKDSNMADIPAISVSPDGTLRITGVEQPKNDDIAPPAPPPVPPPITPPSK